MTDDTPKYPQVKVQLVGLDGNAYAILGRCRESMREAGLSEEDWEKFNEEVKDGDHDHLLATCVEYFDVS